MSRLIAWATYDRWSNAIADEFFSGRFAGRPVYLDLEEDVLARVAEAAEFTGDPTDGFVAAVAPTISLFERRSLFGAHAVRLRRWRTDPHTITAPPVVGVLAFMSLVAEHMRGDAQLRPHNYYGRFIETLGGNATDPNLRAKVVRGFAQHSSEMWNALNRWLEAEPETRGVPTAYSFDHRVYVGRALSQALVRDGDRRALHLLFAEIGLRPGQVVAVEDMLRILEAWLPDSPVSQTLRRLARDPEVLARVAEVACVELQSWAGDVEQTATGGTRLALTATVRRLPRRVLSLGAAVVLPPGVEALAAGPACDEAGRAAIAAVGGTLRLLPADSAGWRAVAEVGIADLLLSRFEAVAEDVAVRRQTRPVVVFGRDELSAVFREVERVRLGGEHLLLVIEAVRPRLERELGLVARDGWCVHEALAGLPQGWLLYEGVEIVAITETMAPDLGVLVPVAWTELSLEAGLKLPGRATWHALAAPEMRASSPAGRPIDVLLFREIDPGIAPPGQDEAAGEELEAAGEELDPAESQPTSIVEAEASEQLEGTLATLEGAIVLPLASEELDAGDYRLVLADARAGRVLSATPMRLRSADLPFDREPCDLRARGPEDGALWPLSASLPGDGEALEPEDVEQTTNDAPPAEDEPPRASVPVPACYVSGAHHFVLDPAGRERPSYGATTGGSCKYCGLEKRFPARPQGRGHRGRAPMSKLERATARPKLPPRLQSESIDGELLLDALSCLRRGSAAEIVRMLDRADSPALLASESLRMLSALGHIDVSLDAELRPARWAVAPTTIVVSADGAHLAGMRSQLTLQHLGRITQIAWEEQGVAPPRIALPGVQSDMADALAAELENRISRTVCVRRSPSEQLVDRLPSLADLRASLPRLVHRPVSAELEKAIGHRWVRADTSATDGAYRTTRMPRVTWHQIGGDARRVDARLAKWLTARPDDLMAADTDRARLVCNLGAEPPWLYERALVASSGRAPIVDPQTYTVTYIDVPASLTARFRAAVIGAPMDAHA